ncbi:MAG TPA: methyltransferase domain-containing protein [Ktedonobacterales bacterium]
MSEPEGGYSTTYSLFDDAVSAQLRQEIYGEDIGQNSWLTADEYRTWLVWLNLTPAAHALEVGCGSGGPALFLARETGARVTGVDIDEHGVAQANRMARELDLAERAQFQRADASQLLPFEDVTFDAIVCIDAINHLPNRLAVLREWRRMLKPGGRLLFTDPLIVTGILSSEEVAIRSSMGLAFFAPMGENARLIAQAGLALEREENATANVTLIGERRVQARQARPAEVIAREGQETFDRLQRFYAMAQTLASEGRLSRYVFFARKAS